MSSIAAGSCSKDDGMIAKGKGKCKYSDFASQTRAETKKTNAMCEETFTQAKEHEERVKLAEVNYEKLMDECDEEDSQCEIWKAKVLMVQQQLAE